MAGASWNEDVLTSTENAHSGIGSPTDAASTGDGSLIAVLKQVRALLTSLPVTGTFWQSTQPVSLATAPSTPVTGTFWQATQPVSLASAPSTPVTGTFWQSTQPVSGTVTANAGSGTLAVSLATAPSTPVTGTFWQATQPVSLATAPSTPVTGTFWQTTQPVSLASLPEARASTLWVTATGAVNTAVTATLPAPGGGLFHYITRIEVVKLYSVIGVAAGAGVIITSTNLGGPTFTTQQLASAAGTAVTVVDWTPATPHRAAASMASTIVCPAQLQTIWRINISYFTAA